MNWLSQQFELARSGADSNLRPMEGLRGFAVLLVFFVHYVSLTAPWVDPASALHAFAQGLHTIGNTGVDLFFVLSGYLIYGSLISRPQPFLRFMSRRVERIYPAFLAVLIVYIALSFAIPSESKIPDGAADASLYIVENVLLLPGIFPIAPIITVAWSLSYEMFYYLAIPVLITMFALRNRTTAARIGSFAAIALAILVQGALFGGLVRLSMFVSGIVLYEVIQHSLLRPPGPRIAALTLVGGLACMLIPIQGPQGAAFRTAVLFVAFGLVCFSCFRRSDAWFTRAFTWTPLRWLGNMSYSYYLLHGLALKAGILMLAYLVPPAPKGAVFFFGLMPLLLAVTLVASAALFILIERPLSLTPRRRPAQAAQQRV